LFADRYSRASIPSRALYFIGRFWQSLADNKGRGGFGESTIALAPPLIAEASDLEAILGVLSRVLPLTPLLG
jgi:hypothetical protein